MSESVISTKTVALPALFDSHYAVHFADHRFNNQPDLQMYVDYGTLKMIAGFDFGLTAIPPNSVITRAVMRLYKTRGDTIEPWEAVIGKYSRYTEQGTYPRSWNEVAYQEVWDGQTGYGDVFPIPPTYGGQGYVDSDVTSLVQYMVDNNVQDHMIFTRLTERSGTRSASVWLASANYNAGNYRPILEVTYETKEISTTIGIPIADSPVQAEKPIVVVEQHVSVSSSLGQAAIQMSMPVIENQVSVSISSEYAETHVDAHPALLVLDRHSIIQATQATASAEVDPAIVETEAHVTITVAHHSQADVAMSPPSARIEWSLDFPLQVGLLSPTKNLTLRSEKQWLTLL